MHHHKRWITQNGIIAILIVNVFFFRQVVDFMQRYEQNNAKLHLLIGEKKTNKRKLCNEQI